MSEEPVTISETEIKEISKEIAAVDDAKIASVKKEALDEVAKLRAEIEAEKAKIAEIERLNEELKAAKAAREAASATTKAIIPEAVNNPAKPTVPDVPVLTHDEAWAVLGQSVHHGRWSGTFTKQ